MGQAFRKLFDAFFGNKEMRVRPLSFSRYGLVGSMDGSINPKNESEHIVVRARDEMYSFPEPLLL